MAYTNTTAGKLSWALNSARTLLNDYNSHTWTDAKLVPLIQEGFRELNLELQLHDVSVMREQSSVILVKAGWLQLFDPLSNTDYQPADLVLPKQLFERDPGTDAEEFLPMTQTAYIPQLDQTDELIYWAWNQQRIKFLGATANREVQVNFVGRLPLPTLATDTLGFIGAELYLGPRAASLAYQSTGNIKSASYFDKEAKLNLEKIITLNVVADQNLPVRRLPYRRGRQKRIR